MSVSQAGGWLTVCSVSGHDPHRQGAARGSVTGVRVAERSAWGKGCVHRCVADTPRPMAQTEGLPLPAPISHNDFGERRAILAGLPTCTLRRPRREAAASRFPARDTGGYTGVSSLR